MVRILLILATIVTVASAAAAAVHHVPGDHPTIQAAVAAAAAGDTVAVAAGVYEEQVVIDRELTLLGAGAEQTVVQAPPDLPIAFGLDQYRGVICVSQAAGQATVVGLAIDGLGRPPASGRFVGLLYYRAGGRVAELVVRNVHNTPAGGNTYGIGILATLDMMAFPISLEIASVEIRRFENAGLIISGAGYSADITDVEIDPEDIYSTLVQNGIELNRLSSARVVRCTVRNVTYLGQPRPEYTAVGLLVNRLASLEMRDIDIEGCQTGCYLVRSPGVIEGLSVTSPSAAADPVYGLVAVNAVNLDMANNGPDAIRAPRPLMSGVVAEDRPPVTYEIEVRDPVLDGGGHGGSRGIVARSLTAEAMGLTVERGRITGWNEGALALEGGFGSVFARLSGCRIEDNLAYGLRALTASPLDARGCRWGDVSGPLHPVTNPGGLGDQVSDLVLYDPWLTGNLAPLPLPQRIALASFDGTAYTDTVSIEYLGGADDRLYGFSVRLEWDPEIIELVSIERPARGRFAEAAFFQTLIGTDAATIDAVLGGEQEGVSAGPLCTVSFAAVGTPDWSPAPIAVSLVHARNDQNQAISGIATDDGIVAVDLQPPVISLVRIENETLAHTDDFAKDGDLLAVTATITDGDPNFNRGGIRGIGAYLYGAVSLILPPDTYAGDQARWNPRPALLTPANGLALFLVEAIDPSGNVLSPLVADTLIADNIRPQPVSGLVAIPGHNQVSLNWDDASGSDAHYWQTIVRANRWQDYPFYDGQPPAYPAGAQAGESVYAGSETAVTPTYPADGSERDILYYSVMAVDMAGNVSLLASGSRARATNYRLGDVRGAPAGSPGDGLVNLYDITQLGDTYGLLRGEPGFDGECDIAPADGGTAGVPEPDGAVDFEDLMIFAGQFDIGASGGSGASGGTGGDGGAPVLRWEQVAAQVWALILDGPCPALKGLRLQGEAVASALRLEAGALLHDQPGPWFLHPGRGGFEAHLAVLGRGIGIEGEGELLRLVASEPITLPAPAIIMRDIANEPLEGHLPTGVSDQPALPSVFRAGPPAPNPFNAATEIAFDLPAAQRVRLEIFGLDGRRVSTLLDHELPTGRHAAIWNGRDRSDRMVASGMYLYRLVAGPWSATGKLELVK